MASIERTARMLSPSPLIFSRRVCAVSLMCLCSTRVWLRSASGLKAATRRLSCTTRCCNRLQRAPRVGARRIGCRCWQDLPSGCQRSHPVWQGFYNSGERWPLCGIRISSRSCWRARFDGVQEQACVRRAGSRLWHAPSALAGRKCACVRACISCLRARVWWARAVLERANYALSNGIGVSGGPVYSPISPLTPFPSRGSWVRAWSSRPSPVRACRVFW